MLEAYTGSEPYVFVSYSHRDMAQVEKYIEALQRSACNIWYDKGIASGGFWSDDIATHLQNASCVLWFVSEHSIASDYVLGELNFAVSRRMPILPVYLQNVTLPIGMEILLGRIQAIFAEGREYSEVLKNIRAHLPPKTFHETGVPFHTGKAVSLYIRDTSTVFPDGTYFSGEDDNSFEIYWAAVEPGEENHLLWKYRSRPGYDMRFKITKCTQFQDPYFDENGNGAVIFNLLLNFWSKYPVPWPDVDVLLTLAVIGPESGSPRIHLLDRKAATDSTDEPKRLSAFIETLLCDIQKDLENGAST